MNFKTVLMMNINPIHLKILKKKKRAYKKKNFIVPDSLLEM